jgi:dihydroorotase
MNLLSTAFNNLNIFYPTFATMANTIIKQATIVNDGVSLVQDLLIKGDRIEKIAPQINISAAATEIDAQGLVLMPGVIDDQVHFREPGLTHKANIHTESAAAVAGGTTSFMEMPNTVPNALSFDILEQKYAIGAATSPANYSFFMGVSNDNAEEALQINKKKEDYCGLKIFMGSSTGNMLVDNYLTLNTIFRNSEVLIATHCEREEIVKANLELAINTYGDDMQASVHPIIRDVLACYESSYSAIQLAKQTDARLHILHISTAKELQLFGNMMPLADKRITAEVCVHHLHFTSDDYAVLGNQIKCNPAIKAPENKAALWQGLLDNKLDIIATDHAPHTWDEKQQKYLQAPAGVPLVQHSLQLMLDYVHEGKISIDQVVDKMCHAPAICFKVRDRGYVREGYYADLTLADLTKPNTVNKENILHKCAWSPFEGHTFKSSIAATYVNGNLAWNGKEICTDTRGMRMKFS